MFLKCSFYYKFTLSLSDISGGKVNDEVEVTKYIYFVTEMYANI